MRIDLKNKKALIGAATDGLGKAIAIELSKLGSSITIVARNEEKLKNTLSQLDVSQGQKHQYLVVDYNNFKENKELYDDYFKHNSVDILVNNTNGPKAGDMLSQTTDDYLNAFELLFQNTVYITQLALPYMREKGFGRIINVSGSSVKEPIDSLTSSSTMRVALVSWMKTLSKKVASSGITVNSILTGMFNTERLSSYIQNTAKQNNLTEEAAMQQLLETLPMKRVGKPEEYAYLVSFLSSDLAGYLTGATIPLDGGTSNYL